MLYILMFVAGAVVGVLVCLLVLREAMEIYEDE